MPSSETANTLAPTTLEELFRAAFLRFKGHVQACATDLGLSPLQLVALRNLDEPVPMGQLAGELFMDPSVMTALADQLEEGGYLERRVSPRDRRVKELVLTAEGRALRQRAIQLVAEGNPFWTSLDPGERAQLARLLERIVKG